MSIFEIVNIQRTSSALIITALIVTLLIYAQSIIVPFVFALLFWFVAKKIRNFLDRVAFIKKYVPSWIKSVLASFLIFYLIIFIAEIVSLNIENIVNSYQKYASNVDLISHNINEVFKIDLNEEISNFVINFDFAYYLKSIVNSISEIIGSLVMVIFYVVFLFVEESLFQHKMELIVKDKEQFIGYKKIIKKVDKSMSSYLSLKTLISLMTTTLSYFVLLAAGIDSPLFWAFLIFIFNFIPSVGPILGTVLPALFSLLQFGEFVPFLIIFFGAGTIAVLVGSFVEPKLMGNTLNISPLVAILSLAIWGSIWGITGMLLCVPITVAMIIIFSQFSSTRSLAILLSEKGTV